MNATGAHACIKCKSGMFSDQQGMELCKPCLDPSTETSDDGSTFCYKCIAGKFLNGTTGACESCSRGMISKFGAQACEFCSRGYYQDQKGQVSCIACMAGKHGSNAASADRTIEDVACESCSAGRYSTGSGITDATGCINCPPGWLQEFDGESGCIKPKPGFIAAGGSSSVAIAEGWTATDCFATDGICKSSRPCDPGTFENGTRICIACPVGWSSTEGKTSCNVCSKGKFSKAKGSLCEDCPAGWFQDQNVRPSMECRRCPLGYGAVENSLGEPVAGSAICRNLNFIIECPSAEEYLNDTLDDPATFKCEQCPSGGNCLGEAVTWSRIRPLFGWWKIPAGDRAGNASWKSTEAFSVLSSASVSLLNPDCVALSASAAKLFFIKQAVFAGMPFLAVLLSFPFWYAYACVKQTPFSAKHRGGNKGRGSINDSTATNVTPKDKFVVTVTVVIYLMYPTLVTQAFQIFNCKTIAGVQYMSVDLDHPCFEGDHLTAVLTLGIGQLLVFVLGLPLLTLLFLWRNHTIAGGLKRRVVQVRYGLFVGQYREERYYWEILLTMRKVGVVALSVFGRVIGTQRQAQIALAILLVCTSLEIAGDPYRIVNDRYRVLGRLEIGSLFCLWATMWGGTLIFASQAPGDENVVVAISVVVLLINLGVGLWLVYQLVKECLVAVSTKGKNPSHTGEIEFVSSAVNPLYSKNRIEAGATSVTVGKTPKAVPSTPKAVPSTPKAEATGATDASWTRLFDKDSSRFYLYDEKTGRSRWEEKVRYLQHKSADGVKYYVPESGSGKSVWHLPESAELVVPCSADRVKNIPMT
eukprot:g312.t1